MATPAGWYDDGSGRQRWWDGTTWTDHFQDAQTPVAPAAAPAAATTQSGGMIAKIQADATSGAVPRPGAAGANYVVLQVILKEKFWGTGSGNLTELEGVINAQAALGYRLHTISTTSSGSKGLGGGDRVQATMVFERMGLS